MLHWLTAGMALCIRFGPGLPGYPVRGTSSKHICHVSSVSPNSRSLRTVTIRSTLLIVPLFMGYRTSSTDSVPAGHYLEGWVDGSVKPKRRVQQRSKVKVNVTGRSVLRLEVTSSPKSVQNIPNREGVGVSSADIRLVSRHMAQRGPRF